MTRIVQYFRSYKNEDTITGWLMVSPWIIGFLVFFLGPMIASLVLSFMEWDLISPPEFVGINNYLEMFVVDPLAMHSLKITMIFAFFSIPINIVIGLAIAMLLNTKIKGLAIFRTIYYLPAVLAGVAVALLWRWIFSSEFGLLNLGLSLIGIEGPAWLSDKATALPSFVIMRIWGVGAMMVIYLAGLQSIPTEFYEAAEIDGANWLQRTFKITLPLLTPTIFFQLIVGLIFAMQIFTEPLMMTNGGPANATLFYILYLYRQAFQYFNMGYASALAWLFFLVVLLLTLFTFRSARSWVYYEGSQEGES
ncbi:MAG: carbohydrate ABC transporter permease [Anaerolineales bacterium]|jgi:multiple sugar transport system permease protein